MAGDFETADFLVCAKHDSPVTWHDGVITHWDGGYCSSPTFTTEFLSRRQAGTLLRIAVGVDPEG